MDRKLEVSHMNHDEIVELVINLESELAKYKDERVTEDLLKESLTQIIIAKDNRITALKDAIKEAMIPLGNGQKIPAAMGLVALMTGYSILEKALRSEPEPASEAPAESTIAEFQAEWLKWDAELKAAEDGTWAGRHAYDSRHDVEYRFVKAFLRPKE